MSVAATVGSLQAVSESLRLLSKSELKCNMEGHDLLYVHETHTYAKYFALWGPVLSSLDLFIDLISLTDFGVIALQTFLLKSPCVFLCSL